MDDSDSDDEDMPMAFLSSKRKRSFGLHKGMDPMKRREIAEAATTLGRLLPTMETKDDSKLKSEEITNGDPPSSPNSKNEAPAPETGHDRNVSFSQALKSLPMTMLDRGMTEMSEISIDQGQLMNNNCDDGQFDDASEDELDASEALKRSTTVGTFDYPGKMK